MIIPTKLQIYFSKLINNQRNRKLCLQNLAIMIETCIDALKHTESDENLKIIRYIKNNIMTDLLDLGPSASQSSDGGASAAFRILVDSSLHCCLFWAMHLRCSRSSLVVSCSVFSCSLDRSLLRTTGSVVKGRPRNFFPCVAK